MIITSLPSPETVNALLKVYFDTYEKIYPLFASDDIWREVSEFWENPQDADDAWLSQLYMMLALACQSVTCWAGQSEDYLDAAGAAFQRSPFMSAPKLSTLRTLCMMAIAKQSELITMDDYTSLWVLMGYVVRTAMGKCLS